MHRDNASELQSVKQALSRSSVVRATQSAHQLLCERHQPAAGEENVPQIHSAHTRNKLSA